MEAKMKKKDGCGSGKSSGSSVQRPSDRKLSELRGKFSRLSASERRVVWRLVEACADCLSHKCTPSPEGCPTYAAILKEASAGVTEASANGTKSGLRVQPA